MKRILAFFCLMCVTLFADSDDIGGFWKTVNEQGVPQCVIAVYEYDGVYYGRIIGTYNDQGKMDDTIYSPKQRAPGIVGDPYYSGLDIIWDLKNSGVKYKGKIVDPQKGNVYNSELWVNSKGNLVVRGKYLIFGRSQEWLPANTGDFPADFKIPDLEQMVPKVPEVK